MQGTPLAPPLLLPLSTPFPSLATVTVTIPVATALHARRPLRAARSQTGRTRCYRQSIYRFAAHCAWSTVTVISVRQHPNTDGIHILHALAPCRDLSSIDGELEQCGPNENALQLL